MVKGSSFLDPSRTFPRHTSCSRLCPVPVPRWRCRPPSLLPPKGGITRGDILLPTAANIPRHGHRHRAAKTQGNTSRTPAESVTEMRRCLNGAGGQRHRGSGHAGCHALRQGVTSMARYSRAYHALGQCVTHLALLLDQTTTIPGNHYSTTIPCHDLARPGRPQ